MIKLLLAGQEGGSLSSLSKILEQYDNVSVLRIDSEEIALDLIHYQKVDFAIVDEQLKETTGLQFVEKMVVINPMMNSALISSLSAEDFHEASEGLGITAQLPVQPDEKRVEDLMSSLNKILGMKV
ncbi:MAG: hypothetical protein HN580_00315 [Deltaproteobacteria bacterium]|jgi:two-component SAPR family response regulator|nr:hypothetical protein [Deltaproteobacteria bacterium]MBT4090444.1 hypothetical protein [Deltaproteobacteria bacterium]MBT4263780.1 hypothetical protein [Deltaproteobacteria bacterium]MBT4643321.1 hypothetical protein [Deltaproteobacteria bacterium]MBT6498688.1 hypothetical protein [Deltaproteobacteria bacterium]